MTKIFTIAANEIIGPFSTETTMLQFEYDSEKAYDVLTQVCPSRCSNSRDSALRRLIP